MRVRSILLFVGVVAAASGACSSFSGSDTAAPGSDGGEGGEGGSGSDGGAGDGGSGGSNDGGAAVPDEAGCTPFLHANFADPAQNWVTSGSARVDGGSVQLTDGNTGYVGAIFAPAPDKLTSFEVAFTLSYASAGTPADGVAMSWATNAMVPVNGRSADALGFCADTPPMNSPIGSALEYDVFNGRIRLQRSDGTMAGCSTEGTNTQTFTASQRVTARITPAIVTTAVQGSAVLSFMTQGTSLGPTKWLGFSAGFGAARAAFTVDDVTFSTCQ